MVGSYKEAGWSTAHVLSHTELYFPTVLVPRSRIRTNTLGLSSNLLGGTYLERIGSAGG